MINAHSQITSTDLESKRKLKGIVHTNRTNTKIFDMMNRSMPAAPKLDESDTPGDLTWPGIFVTGIIFAGIMIYNNSK